MKHSEENTDKASLRVKAESLLDKKLVETNKKISEFDSLKLVHELQVHQIELELQNEELMLAKEQAEEAAEKYLDLYDFAPSGFFTLSKEKTILELNLSGSLLLGNSRSYLENKLFPFFLSADTIPIFNLFFERVFDTKTKEKCEVKLVTDSDIPTYVLLSGIISKNQEQCNISMVDISEHILVEQELIIAKNQAQESDHLKSAFLANMSHEIRTPMNGLLGFAELLKTPNLTGEQQQKYINIIEKSSARMLNILNDIIAISKIEEGLMELDFEELNINEQCDDIYTFFKPEVEAKGLTFSHKNSLPAHDATITIDSQKVYFILTNLVKNAIKYCKKGSIEFGYTKKDNVLQFYVKDTGIGIPKDRQVAIFDRFVQADIADKKAQQGAGLGLTISKAYVEMLGGKIWVVSEEGNGSTFYFNVPFSSYQKNEIDLQKDLTIDKPNNHIAKIKLLIAEDDEDLQEYLSMIIDDFSKETLKASTGIEAVDICRNNTDIDVVLMDIKMPMMNGYEATRQIREFNKEVIIIAQTAFGLIGDKEKAIDAGCNDFIAKPFKQAELLALIQMYVKK